MSYKHITIYQLTNIEANYHLEIKARVCAVRMNIGKDKVYTYYALFEQGLSVEQIFQQYRENKRRCGRKKKELSNRKLEQINRSLDEGWSLDAISWREKLENNPECLATTTLYKRVKEGLTSVEKLRRKGKQKPRNHQETRGKINTCKTIHERNETYPNAKNSQEYDHFEGDTIIGKQRKSAIVTLVEKKSKYIILLKAGRKSERVKDATLNWLRELSQEAIQTITFDRGKEFSKWEEIEEESLIPLNIYFSDPGSPGQRGLNENSNGLVRKELPKSTDLSQYSQEVLNQISMKYNQIPRKSLGYYTAEEIVKKATGLNTLLPIA